MKDQSSLAPASAGRQAVGLERSAPADKPDGAEPADTNDTGPAPVTYPTTGLTVRDLRFGRGMAPARWWLNGDPVGSAWHNALSATFPRGEAFFIETVKACRAGAPPALDAAIRQFIRQEINHSREHLAFNRHAEAAGYDFSGVDAHVDLVLSQARSRPAPVQLAATIALEHFTAIMAHDMLVQPARYAGADPEVADLWRWHAIEEIEHKAVAFDTWCHATRDWPPRRRWLLRCSMMLIVTRNFIWHRWLDTLDLLGQDGIRGWRAKMRVIGYLAGRPGVLRRIAPAWLGYFRPRFHPWKHDDRALIATVAADLQRRTVDQAA